jgi:6-pyruvoyltetrahydropterin/6-carboxytetrahydropterin synthase
MLALGATHKCSRVHGHTWHVEVTEKATKLDKRGMVIDFAEFGDAEHYIDQFLDHRNMNEVAGLSVPTAENIAKWIWDKVAVRHKGLERVRVWESETSWAEYGP